MPTPWILDSPEALVKAYSSGLVGAYRDPAADERFAAGVPHPVFEDVAGHLQASIDRKINALLHRAAMKYDAEFGFWERQSLSDCVTHCTRNGIWVVACVEIDIKGDPEGIPARFCTELFYGARGYRGDGGMSCATAAKFASDTGGVLLRGNYPDGDLSKYNPSLALKFGGGIPSSLLELAKKHQIKTVSRVTTIEGAIAALQNGYALSVCSGQGFSSTRDEQGFSSPRGSWSHAMAWVAYRGTESGREGFLVQNSWGKFNSGPLVLGQPEGSFWIDLRVAEKMLSGGGSFAFSAFDGFPAQKLLDYGFSSYV